MVTCLNSPDVKEETPLYDDFDPLKEWLVDPDPVQLQNPFDYSNLSLEPQALHYGGLEIEHKGQVLESSIDVKMEKVSLLEISDGQQGGEVGLKETRGVNDVEINYAKFGLEALKRDRSFTNKEGTCEGESDDEKGSMSVVAESDCGDSSSDESSSDESRSTAKSVSSSEDEDDVGMKSRETAGEFEEGEGRDVDAHEIDFLTDEEEGGPKGPIRSKHEVEDLPPVPKVDVSLQPHHQLFPVGVILSKMTNRVVVEGSVRHNPLDEGSILWVTDTRLPLGLVDEIFGPVKNPYYVVRYNTEEEVPAGVEVGMSVSFVVQFASQILNDKDLYKKGYDASGDNDEEVDNDFDFSDDEKEAEYKKSLRQGKRVNNDRIEIKPEIRIERKRTNFVKPTLQHKDMQKQQICAPLSIVQPRPTNPVPPQSAAFLGQSGIGRGSWNSSGPTNSNLPAPSRMLEFPQALHAVNYVGNSSQQLIVDLRAPSRKPEFPQAMQTVNFLGNSPRQLNVDLRAPSRMPKFSQSMQAVNFLGNSPQQLNVDLRAPSRRPEFPQAMPAVNYLGNSPQQLNADLTAPSRMPQFPQAMQAVTFLGNSAQQLSADLTAPSRMPEFPQAMQAANFLGNSSQQLVTPNQETLWPPGFSPQIQNTGFQGDLTMQLQNQNLLLNNLVNMIAFQQQLQQLIPNQGSNFPWFGAASSSPQPLGQNNIAPSPLGNGFISAPGPQGPGNEQIQGQAPPPFAPSIQFNAGNSSSLNLNGRNSRSHGRPFHRGGGRFFGRGGRQPNR